MLLSKKTWTSVDLTFSLPLSLSLSSPDILSSSSWVQDVILSYLVFCNRPLIDLSASSLLPSHPSHTLLLPGWFFWSANHVVFLLKTPKITATEWGSNSLTCDTRPCMLWPLLILSMALSPCAKHPEVLKTYWILSYPWACACTAPSALWVPSQSRCQPSPFLLYWLLF